MTTTRIQKVSSGNSGERTIKTRHRSKHHNGDYRDLIMALVKSIGERRPKEAKKHIDNIILEAAKIERLGKEDYQCLLEFITKSLSVSTEESKFISTGEAAKKLGVSDQTILNWIDAGKLKAERTIGGHYRLNVDQFKTSEDQDAAFDSYFDRMHRKDPVSTIIDDDDLEGI